MKRSLVLTLILIAGISFALSYQFAAIAGFEKIPEILSKSHFSYSSEGKYSYSNEKIDRRESVDVQMGWSEIELNTVSIDVELKVHQANQVKVEVLGYGNDKSLPAKLLKPSSDKLLIDLNEDNSGWGISFSDIKATVYLPIEYQHSLRIKGVSSDIRAEKVSAQKLDIKTVSGDVKISDSEHSDIQMQTVSGDIALEADTEYLKIKTTSGDAEFDVNKVKKSADLQSVSGDFQVRGSLKDRVRLDLKSVSGDFRAPSFVSVTEGYGRTQSTYHPDSATVSLMAQTVSGDVDFER